MRDDAFDDRLLYKNRWALCADLAHIQGSKQNTRVHRQIGRGWKGAQLEMVRGKGNGAEFVFRLANQRTTSKHVAISLRQTPTFVVCSISR